MLRECDVGEHFDLNITESVESSWIERNIRDANEGEVVYGLPLIGPTPPLSNTKAAVTLDSPKPRAFRLQVKANFASLPSSFFSSPPSATHHFSTATSPGCHPSTKLSLIRPSRYGRVAAAHGGWEAQAARPQMVNRSSCCLGLPKKQRVTKVSNSFSHRETFDEARNTNRFHGSTWLWYVHPAPSRSLTPC